MRDYKLKIDLLPKGAWDNDLSKTLSKKDWDILRNKCYEKANHRCQICGYETDDLDAHEVWEFNIKTKTQTLKNIIAICSRCHGVIHMRNSQRLGFGENAKKHFMKINHASELDFATHLAEAQILFEERNSVYYWSMVVNLDKFGGQGIAIKNTSRKKIENPYSEKDINCLKNACSLLPRILDIDINNYNGTITVRCDKTNKIEWYNEIGLIKTKYNFGRNFNNTFSVKGLDCNNIYFKLVGNGKTLNSKSFQLTEWE